ncbi:winged helix DNA-binding protein [Altererythrobacter sp. ZODW24]|uniref:winged helix DNA-binding protein n=1 Tax=Altererythrobacter sp. ZODW24 TaxID=2185142 RepID=UPI000DF816E9|nr:winged helix DNA-binding protein [Altererythrobacter sp. ZODW24]
MGQSDFSYVASAANDAALSISVSIFADRSHVRDTMREDAEEAGFRLLEIGDVTALLDGGAKPIGEVVLLDCPVLDAQSAAALTRLDARAAAAGAHLVVSTSVDALDDVFGCLDQSNPQILVDPARAERIIALGRILGQLPNLRLRELSEDDRMTLLRLTQQVGEIAERLEGFSGAVQGKGQREGGGAFRFESPTPSFNGAETEDGSDRLVRSARPPLPDPRLVRRIIRQRQLRARFFESELFADPAWDMLLDLTAARVEHTRVSVTSLCIASGVPPTTALRWITQMTEAGLLERVEDEADRRRAFIALTDAASDAMARYFTEVGKEAVTLV